MDARLSIAQAWDRVERIAGQPLGDLLPSDEADALARDKGGAGQAIERLLGVRTAGHRTDLTDGELKSFRCDRDGDPVESVAICQIGARIDDWLELPRFETTPLYDKLARVILFGVCKESPDPRDWHVAVAFELDARPGRYWFAALERSYRKVMAELTRRLAAGEMFRTVTDECLQLRVRDAQPYTPIDSERLGRRISDKNIGFYLPRAFVRTLVDEALATQGARCR